ncbi:flavoprotein [Haloechinothrix sp. YIM 98757]|uniref:Flavoprotein n=1 Tax=Haloechinothrix aidingensis TaxID=2752311 RepID=A0A838A6T3_9PSEU|nr:flavoprotein [Haloechinothrix aidingensis]
MGTAAPPVFDWPTLFRLLRERGWKPHPVLSPIAATWCDLDELSTAAGVDVRVELRSPTDSDPWPKADAVLAAPLTFNTINKWAGGHNDTLVLGVLNELMGEGVPIVAAPCAKAALQSHPAYPSNIQVLAGSGVTILEQHDTVFRDEFDRANFDWLRIVEALDRTSKGLPES